MKGEGDHYVSGMTRMASRLGESNIRRYGKGIRSSKKSTHMYSDYYEEEKADTGPTLGSQRSVSLSALHPTTVPIEPRMAQLETLEAKMASIEVSLSTAQRRKKNNNSTTPTVATTNIPNNVTNSPYRNPKDIAKELEVLRNTLRDKENVIHSLKGQLCTTLSISRLSASYLQRQNQGVQPLNEKEKKAAEERLQKLRSDLDAKRLAIKNIKLALERLDITDNIDIRIQQAELEYQLGREELNLLSILEESRNLQACLEDAAQNKETATLFNYVKDSAVVAVHAVELVYDPKSPRFGAGPRDDGSGLYVEWATEDSGLMKGDRLLEVNGKIILVKSKEDMQRLLSVSPDPAQIVVLRKQPPQLDQLMTSLRQELLVVREKAGEAERTRDSFRSDNVRLTHRISYLEEQVAELLERAREETHQSSVTLPVSPTKSNQQTTNTLPKNEMQVFQKGPQVTALVVNVPGLEVGNKCPTESKQLPTIRSRHSTNSKDRDESKINDSRSVISLDLCNNETEKATRGQNNSKKRDASLQNTSTNSLVLSDPESTATKSNQLSTSSLVDKKSYDHNGEGLGNERKTHYHRYSENHQTQRQKYLQDARSALLFDYTDKDKYANKSLDFDSEPSYNRPRMHHSSRQIETSSQKSLDYSSESSFRHYKKNLDTKLARPIPPKKPLRLSLHRATSLQSVETPEKKPIKRNHKGEAPPAIPQSALCWPSSVSSINTVNAYRCKSSLGEKWC